MAVLNKQPSKAIVDGLAHVYDFYTWKGRWCVRKWPEHYKYSPQFQETHNRLIDMNAKWKALPVVDKRAWKFFCERAPWTGRDAFAAMTMLGKLPRPLYHFQNYILLPGIVRVVFTWLMGPPTQLRYRYSPTPVTSDVFEWRGVNFPVNKCLESGSIIPTFHDLKNLPGTWGLNKAFFDIPYEHSWLFFFLDDPERLREYATGVYHFPV